MRIIIDTGELDATEQESHGFSCRAAGKTKNHVNSFQSASSFRRRPE